MKFWPILVAAHRNTVSSVKNSGNRFKEALNNTVEAMYELLVGVFGTIIWPILAIFALLFPVIALVTWPALVTIRALYIYVRAWKGYYNTLKSLNLPNTPTGIYDIERYEKNLKDLDKAYGVRYPRAEKALEAMKIQAILANKKY
jgi:hypothetical protein